MDVPKPNADCPQCKELIKIIEQLQAQVKLLTERLEKVEREHPNEWCHPSSGASNPRRRRRENEVDASSFPPRRDPQFLRGFAASREPAVETAH